MVMGKNYTGLLWSPEESRRIPENLILTRINHNAAVLKPGVIFIE